MLINLTENEIIEVSGGDYADMQLDLPDWPIFDNKEGLAMLADKDWQLYVDNFPIANEFLRSRMRDDLEFYKYWSIIRNAS